MAELAERQPARLRRAGGTRPRLLLGVVRLLVAWYQGEPAAVAEQAQGLQELAAAPAAAGRPG